jgi:acetylornithine/N-succinyldiaminopimelate aminotransferase
MTATATQSSAETIEQFQKYVVPNYARYPVSLVRGEGSHVWDAEGNRYLDFFPGWGCNLLGHCPPAVVEAVQDQIATLIHVPNTWHTPWQGQWAQALSERSFGGQAFFCNSGTEANEAAIKLARLHTPKERYKIITFTGGFHGRTLGATSATAQPKYHEGLGPLMAGFVYAPFGDLNAVKNLIDRETAAIMIEPVQGEGGINIPPPDFLPGLRQLCDENNLLLMFDEVQTGCGRTGQWFAYEHFGVVPDVMTLAKALCGGVAGGALLTTFGGNPIAARAGLAYIEAVENENLLEHSRKISEVFRKRLEQMRGESNLIREVRILGLMIGVELTAEGAPIVKRCLERRLLINATHGTVLRLLPALNISEDQVHEGCDIIADVLKHHSAA